MRAVLLQSLLQNKLEGVTKGFLVYLRISGIGYRASLTDQTLTFKLGYSHDIAYELPPAMRAFLPEPTLIGLYGIDKNQVGAAGLVGVTQKEASYAYKPLCIPHAFMLQCKEQLLFALPGISRLQEHSMLEHCQQLQNTRPLLKPGLGF